ncbi:MAG: TIGR00282 family metallophosphoesterase [Clostridiales bacterium]|nr:TIGR00282 family metallophosphoesterase [Clostridiales bacterium]
MKILAVGDVVGVSGTEFIRKNLWNLRKENKIDFTVLNGENAAKGNGLDRSTAETLLASGADVITSGNHIWKKYDVKGVLEDMPCVLRPANFPDACPGNGSIVTEVNGVRILVVSLIGNVYMQDSYTSPFEKADALLEKYKGEFDVSVVDFHAEATSEKIALSKYLDGRVSAVFGTHTHVQTADAKILPRGTATVTDVGMTGAYDSVLGIKYECVLDKFLLKMPIRFEEADGKVMFNGAVFDIDEKTGKSTDIKTLNFVEN